MDKRSKSDIWHKIIPFPIGTHVRKIKNEALLHNNRIDPPLLSEGDVIDYVDVDWKNSMIRAGCYSEDILGETMYHVRFKCGGFAVRGRELKVIEEDEQ